MSLLRLGTIAALVSATCVFALPRADAESIPDHSSIGLIEDGFDALIYRLHLVRTAERSVDIQTFIWENDESGHAFVQACVEAAERGVRVRFLMDHLYSDRDLDTAAALAQVHPNFEIRRYRPPGDRLKSGLRKSAAHTVLAFRPRNQRMHNKTMIVDESIAIVGGRNISNDYFNQSSTSNYLDREVFVKGPLITELTVSFEAYWNFDRSVPLGGLRDVRRRIEKNSSTDWTPQSDSQVRFQQTLDPRLGDGEEIEFEIQALMHGVENARLSVDPPGKNRRYGFFALWGPSRTADDLLGIMADAEEHILIETPYLILDRSSTRFFRKLNRERPELDVKIVTDSYASTGNMASYGGTFRSRVRALALGFGVYEMKPHPGDKPLLVPVESVLTDVNYQEVYLSIHAKSMVVDHRVSYVGSFNMDPRSIHLNTEIGIIIDDAGFARLLEPKIELLMQPGNSWAVKSRTFPLAGVNRKAEWVSRHLPLDLWPISSTVVVEGEPDNEVIGVLPVKDRWSKKRWLLRVNRALGFVMRPIL